MTTKSEGLGTISSARSTDTVPTKHGLPATVSSVRSADTSPSAHGRTTTLSSEHGLPTTVSSVRRSTATVATDHGRTTTIPSPDIQTIPSGYLVYSDTCKIRALDAFAPDVMELYEKYEYYSCQPPHPLTSIRINWATFGVDLVLEELKYSEPFASTMCYYQEIHRSGEDGYADFEFRYVPSPPISLDSITFHYFLMR